MSGGSLDAFEMIPTALLRHLGKHLAIGTPDIASLRRLYRRRRTLYEHQTWAARMLGFSSFTPKRAGALLRALRSEAQQTMVVGELVQYARCWLYDHQILVPAERRLREICRRAEDDARQSAFSIIKKCIPKRVRARWSEALYEEYALLGVTRMEWLQEPPARRSPTGLADSRT